MKCFWVVQWWDFGFDPVVVWIGNVLHRLLIWSSTGGAVCRNLSRGHLAGVERQGWGLWGWLIHLVSSFSLHPGHSEVNHTALSPFCQDGLKSLKLGAISVRLFAHSDAKVTNLDPVHDWELRKSWHNADLLWLHPDSPSRYRLSCPQLWIHRNVGCEGLFFFHFISFELTYI